MDVMDPAKLCNPLGMVIDPQVDPGEDFRAVDLQCGAGAILDQERLAARLRQPLAKAHCRHTPHRLLATASVAW